MRTVSGGHGFCGIGRKRLLMLLQERARELGVDLRFETEAPDAATPTWRRTTWWSRATASTRASRTDFADVFKPDIDMRMCKFIWLGTHQKFDDAFTFIFEETEHGWMWVHAYQFDADTATFIVECSAGDLGRVRLRRDVAGGDRSRPASASSPTHLGGHALMSNANHLRGSAWINFPRVLCERWSHENVVLMGDAAATAHFSIGSGTKLALESAIALADYLHSEPTIGAAFAALRGRAPHSRCCAAVGGAQLDWSGSRRSSAISISIRCSSTIRC